MKIGLIIYTKSAKQKHYYKATVNYFKVAAKKRGHKLIIMESSKFDFTMSDKGEMSLLYNGKKMPQVDVMMPRLFVTEGVEKELVLNQQMISMGYQVMNGVLPFMYAKNKIITMQMLAQHGLPIPKTIVIRSLHNFDQAIKVVGGLPVVVKVPQSSMGRGVAIVESKRSLVSSVSVLMSHGASNVILQEYIEEANGSDLRIFIIGDKVLGSMERKASGGDFRSNMHQGGTGNVVKITKEESRIALKAANVLGLDVAGVDIIRSKRGPLIMEVNSSPGLAGITEVTGLDVAGAIIEFMEKKAKKKAAKK